MPKIEVPEDRILESLGELSPEARNKAIRILLPSASWMDQAIERNAPRLKVIAAECGIDWDTASEKQREELIDNLLHEQA